MLVAMAGTAFAGPAEDAAAAYQRGDFATAYRLIHPLADEGNADAQTRLGTMYFEGKGVGQDFAQGLKWFGKAADQGDA